MCGDVTSFRGFRSINSNLKNRDENSHKTFDLQSFGKTQNPKDKTKRLTKLMNTFRRVTVFAHLFEPQHISQTQHHIPHHLPKPNTKCNKKQASHLWIKSGSAVDAGTGNVGGGGINKIEIFMGIWFYHVMNHHRVLSGVLHALVKIWKRKTPNKK